MNLPEELTDIQAVRRLRVMLTRSGEFGDALALWWLEDDLASGRIQNEFGKVTREAIRIAKRSGVDSQ